MELFHVAVFHVDFQNRRQPTTVTSRETTFDQRDVFNRIAIENGEQTADVRHIVDGHAVQNNQILVRTAAAYHERVLPFAARLNARQKLQRFQNIDLAEKHRNLLDLGNWDGNLGHLHLFLDAVLPFRADFDGFHFSTRLELKVDNGVFPKVELQLLGFVTNKTDAQSLCATRQRKTVKTVIVGDNTLFWTDIVDDCRDEFLFRGSIFDVAVERECALRGKKKWDEWQ